MSKLGLAISLKKWQEWRKKAEQAELKNGHNGALDNFY